MDSRKSSTGALQPGLIGTYSIVVADQHTAPFVGSGKVRVLATPVMINLFEAAALACCEQHLPPGHQSLGIHLDVRHIAATPVGMRVTATAELVKIDGRTLSFRVEARAGHCQRRALRPARAEEAGADLNSEHFFLRPAPLLAILSVLY
jgi:predicted thioesterase